jgi:hypothetical protein
MNVEAQALFGARARIMKALAHPTRLFIVDELSRGERCVRELTEMVGADVSTVSKHLSVLRSAGIVADERRGHGWILPHPWSGRPGTMERIDCAPSAPIQLWASRCR